MAKALHDYFCIKTNGSFKFYSKESVSFLLSAANFNIEKQSNYNLKKDPQAKNMFELFGDGVIHIDAFIHGCMEEYFHNGFSDKLLNTLNPNLGEIRNQLLSEMVNGKLVPVYVAHLPMNPPPTVFAACMFANITFLGGLDELKICQSSDCQKFYIGRPNQKWCSDTCGSRTRVKKKRKQGKCT